MPGNGNGRIGRSLGNQVGRGVKGAKVVFQRQVIVGICTRIRPAGNTDITSIVETDADRTFVPVGRAIEALLPEEYAAALAVLEGGDILVDICRGVTDDKQIAIRAVFYGNSDRDICEIAPGIIDC